MIGDKVIGDTVREGLGAFLNGRETADRRRAIGVSDQELAGVLAGAAVTGFAGVVVPELNGVSAAIDAAVASGESFDLNAGLVVALAVGFAATFFLQWRSGPAIVGWIGRRLGAGADHESGRVWLYLAALAVFLVNVAVLLVDLVLGLFAPAAQLVVGWTSLAASLALLLAAIAVLASLARDVLGVAGQARSLLFTLIWIALLILVGLLAAAPPLLLIVGH